MNTAAAWPKQSVVGIPITAQPPVNLVKQIAGRMPCLVTFVNPYASRVARMHPDYAGLLEAFDLVLCDGTGMVWAARRCGLETVQRHSFDATSLAVPILEFARDRNIEIGLVGGREGVAGKASSVLTQCLPGLRFTSVFSGYGEDIEAALDFHARHQTGLVVCGMGAPHQEKFLLDLKARGWKGLGFTCGGFLDQAADGLHYYPRWVDGMNLRFLYRLLREPRRLARRYLVDYPLFIRQVLHAGKGRSR